MGRSPLPVLEVAEGRQIRNLLIESSRGVRHRRALERPVGRLDNQHGTSQRQDVGCSSWWIQEAGWVPTVGGGREREGWLR